MEGIKIKLWQVRQFKLYCYPLCICLHKSCHLLLPHGVTWLCHLKQGRVTASHLLSGLQNWLESSRSSWRCCRPLSFIWATCDRKCCIAAPICFAFTKRWISDKKINDRIIKSEIQAPPMRFLAEDEFAFGLPCPISLISRKMQKDFYPTKSRHWRKGLLYYLHFIIG